MCVDAAWIISESRDVDGFLSPEEVSRGRFQRTVNGTAIAERI